MKITIKNLDELKKYAAEIYQTLLNIKIEQDIRFGLRTLVDLLEIYIVDQSFFEEQVIKNLYGVSQPYVSKYIEKRKKSLMHFIEEAAFILSQLDLNEIEVRIVLSYVRGLMYMRNTL